MHSWPSTLTQISAASRHISQSNGHCQCDRQAVFQLNRFKSIPVLPVHPAILSDGGFCNSTSNKKTEVPPLLPPREGPEAGKATSAYLLPHAVNPPSHTSKNQKPATEGLSQEPPPPTEILREAGARSNISAGYTAWQQAQPRWLCKVPLPLVLWHMTSSLGLQSKNMVLGQWGPLQNKCVWSFLSPKQ